MPVATLVTQADEIQHDDGEGDSETSEHVVTSEEKATV